MTAPESSFDLADAVEAIRDQLLEAAGRGESKGIKFEVGPITLEFLVELRRDFGGRAGVRAWVLSGEASAAATSMRTHKVSLTLTPTDTTTNSKPLVGNEQSGSTALFGARG
ncbi:trypco2 family protein [Streptomyces sp. NPDC046862]|uniref:trypco2 family protein n=1 Tax=Streptomyces sp. NPDC046862 TaxID=3154603 RepID=UPI003453B968